MGRKKSENLHSEKSLDAIFKTKLMDVKEKTGDRIYVNGDDESRVFCIDVPFALKILFQLPGMPMGRFMLIAGVPESCKSALSYEFGRLHRIHGGGYSLIETENKDSTLLRKSIVGYDDCRSSVVYVEFQEEWMTALNYQIDVVKEALDEFTPPRSVPWAFIVDSLAGVTTKSIGEDIDDTGTSKLVQPQQANLLNLFMKRMVHWVGEYPISVFGVNHLKLAPDRYGNLTIKKMQGGYAPKFHESIEINTKPDGKQDVRREPIFEYFKKIKLSVGKNSLAPHSPELGVELVWNFVPIDPSNPDSPVMQRSFFDWGTTSIEYLMKLEGLPAAIRNRVRDIIDLRPGKKGNYVYSEALGIPESEPVTYRVAGRMLDKRLDIQDKLLPCLGIRPCFMFQPGADLSVQRQEAISNIVRITGDLADYIELNPNKIPME